MSTVMRLNQYLDRTASGIMTTYIWRFPLVATAIRRLGLRNEMIGSWAGPGPAPSPLRQSIVAPATTVAFLSVRGSRAREAQRDSR